MHRLIPKGLQDVIVADKTRVLRDEIQPIRETKELQEERAAKRLREYAESHQAIIYDTDKARYYEVMLNFYNNNFFGYGLFGTLTAYNPVTESLNIQRSYDYAKSNLYDFITNLFLLGIFGRFQSLIPRAATTETIEAYEPFKIGSGAESMVFEDTPLRVGKITDIPIEEMQIRNTVPYSVPATYRGTIGDLHIYTQPKLRIPDDSSKALLKLDQLMRERGFTIEGEDTPVRTYINEGENIVIDDVGEGNIGVDLFGRPRLIDFSRFDYPEWIEAFGM